MENNFRPKNDVTSQIRTVLRNSDHVENAAVSELSFKPDFMINMEQKLVLVEIARLQKNENVDWKTLRLIEHIFEAKLF